MAKRRRNRADEYDYLAVKVDSFSVRSSAGLNINFHSHWPSWDCESERVYVGETWLKVHGTCHYPPERSGQRFEITIGGDESAATTITMKDAHSRTADGLPVYRKRGDVQVPVYDRPRGISHLDRGRMKGEWTSWIRANPRLVSDWLVLLSSRCDLYLAIHERKVERRRWIQSLSLQTTDPANE